MASANENAALKHIKDKVSETLAQLQALREQHLAEYNRAESYKNDIVQLENAISELTKKNDQLQLEINRLKAKYEPNNSQSLAVKKKEPETELPAAQTSNISKRKSGK